MKPRSRSPYLSLVGKYVAAVLLVTAAALVTSRLRATFPGAPNSLFFCAVIASAWLGGMGPGILASLLTCLIVQTILGPEKLASLSPASQIARDLIFLAVSLFISWLCSRQRRVHAILRQGHEHLEQLVQARTRDLSSANEVLKKECLERQRIENALRQSETKLAEAQRVAHIGHWERDLATDRITYSAEFARILGLASPTAPLYLPEFQKSIHPDDLLRQKMALADAMAGKSPYDAEFRIVLPQGDVRFAHTLGQFSRDASGRPTVLFGTFQDITERKQAELLLAGQREVLEKIASGAPLSESLTALLRLIELYAPGVLSSILLVDSCGHHLVHGAAPNLPPDYLRAIDGLAIGPAAGSCGTAAFSQAPVFVENIDTDPRWRDYREVALRHGLHACWSTPIFDQQHHVIGTFAMYYRLSALPTPEHLRLIDSTTHLAAIAISRDRDQAGLRESEAKLKKAQQISQIGYWDLDLTTGLVTWSEETWRIVGREPHPGPFPQTELVAMIHPEDRSRRAEALTLAMAHRQPYNIEYRLLRPNGEVRFVHLIDDLVSDPSGRPIRMFGTIQDMTERRLAEALVRSQAEEIKTIVENSPDPIARYDREFRRTYVNPAFIKVSQVPPAALIGKKMGSMLHEGIVNLAVEEVDLFQRSLQQVLDTAKPLDFEGTWPLPSGHLCFDIHLEPEFDAQGQLTSILAISRDITKLKEGEAKIRQIESELARVSRVTIIGELTTSIAHEVNQPLGAMANNADAVNRWLAATPPNLDEARSAVQRIARDAARASDVIRRIRALAKKSEPARTPLHLNEVIEETLALAKPEIARRHVSLQTSLAPNLPIVPADRIQLQQVLLNLVVNAFDSMDNLNGQPRVLRVSSGLDGPDTVQVSVQDTGVGLSPQQADHLFDPFYTTKPDGIGLGLTISRSIVEAHGGRLWAVPNSGPGVTFQFTLPVTNGGAA